MVDNPTATRILRRGGPSYRFAGQLFLVVSTFVVPLSLSPKVLQGSAAALGQLPSFRAAAVLVTLVLGTLIFVLTSKHRLVFRIREHRVPGWIWLLVGLVAWLLLSTPFSNLAPWAPELGSESRMDGTLIVSGWLLLTVVAFGVTTATGVSESSIVGWAVASALITSGWSYLQGIGFDPLTAISGLYLDSPAGAFGHGALASMFVAFVALVAASVWARSRERTAVRLLILAALGIGIASSGGRSAMVGLILGAIVLVIGNRRNGRVLRQLLLFGLTMTIAMGVPLLTVNRTQAQIGNSIDAFSGNDLALNARFSAWRGGLLLLRNHPLFGVGPEGFGFGVWEHLSNLDAATMLRDPLGARIPEGVLENREYLIVGDVISFKDSNGVLVLTRIGWDKAHNYLLDIGLLAGVPAIVVFGALILAMLLVLLRSRSPLALGVGAGLMAFMVFGLAWFPTVSLDPVLWTLVGTGLAFAKVHPRSTGEPD